MADWPGQSFPTCCKGRFLRPLASLPARDAEPSILRRAARSRSDHIGQRKWPSRCVDELQTIIYHHARTAFHAVSLPWSVFSRRHSSGRACRARSLQIKPVMRH